VTLRPRLAALLRLLAAWIQVWGTQLHLRLGTAPWKVAAAGAAALLLLGFPVAMVWISKVDDNPDFALTRPPLGRSHGVAITAALITRELEVNHWRANDPAFLPGGWLRDMPAFQLGLVDGLAHLTQALVVEKGAGWTPNGPDTDLNHAAGLLKYPGTVWKFDTRTSWLPTASAEKQYRNAQRSLDRFNDYLAAGTTSFERSPEALGLLLDALIADIDQSAQAIDDHIANGTFVLFDVSVNSVFYRNKGRFYAHAIVLRDFGRDFETVLGQTHQAEAWGRLIESLAAAARPRPWMLWSAAPESSLLPNHLLAQGYLALRARQQAVAIRAALR
jgi:hypothetical protein